MNASDELRRPLPSDPRDTAAPSTTDDGSIEWCDTSSAAAPDNVASLLLPAQGHNQLARLQWRTSDLIAGIVILAVWRGLAEVLTRFSEAVPDWLGLLVGAVVPMFVIGLFPLWAYRRGGGGWPVRRPPLTRWLLEIGIAIPVLFLMLAVIATLSMLWRSQAGEPPGMDERMQEVAFSGNPILLLVLGLGACLWAPLAEELFFRGFLQNALAQRLPLAVAVILQSGAFALMHPYTGVHLALIGLVGTAFTLHYLWRKTIIATVVLHALFNGLMLLVVSLIMFAASQSGVLGVRLDPKADDCRLTGVYQGTAADAAGLHGGDTITAIDGQPVTNRQALQLAILGKPPGAEVRLTIHRDGRSLDVPLQLSPRQNFTTVIRETPDVAR